MFSRNRDSSSTFACPTSLNLFAAIPLLALSPQEVQEENANPTPIYGKAQAEAPIGVEQVKGWVEDRGTAWGGEIWMRPYRGALSRGFRENYAQIESELNDVLNRYELGGDYSRLPPTLKKIVETGARGATAWSMRNNATGVTFQRAALRDLIDIGESFTNDLWTSNILIWQEENSPESIYPLMAEGNSTLEELGLTAALDPLSEGRKLSEFIGRDSRKRKAFETIEGFFETPAGVSQKQLEGHLVVKVWKALEDQSAGHKQLADRIEKLNTKIETLEDTQSGTTSSTRSSKIQEEINGIKSEIDELVREEIRSTKYTLVKLVDTLIEEQLALVEDPPLEGAPLLEDSESVPEEDVETQWEFMPERSSEREKELARRDQLIAHQLTLRSIEVWGGTIGHIMSYSNPRYGRDFSMLVSAATSLAAAYSNPNPIAVGSAAHSALFVLDRFLLKETDQPESEYWRRALDRMSDQLDQLGHALVDFRNEVKSRFAQLHHHLDQISHQTQNVYETILDQKAILFGLSHKLEGVRAELAAQGHRLLAFQTEQVTVERSQLEQPFREALRDDSRDIQEALSIFIEHALTTSAHPLFTGSAYPIIDEEGQNYDLLACFKTRGTNSTLGLLEQATKYLLSVTPQPQDSRYFTDLSELDASAIDGDLVWARNPRVYLEGVTALLKLRERNDLPTSAIPADRLLQAGRTLQRLDAYFSDPRVLQAGVDSYRNALAKVESSYNALAQSSYFAAALDLPTGISALTTMDDIYFGFYDLWRTKKFGRDSKTEGLYDEPLELVIEGGRWNADTKLAEPVKLTTMFAPPSIFSLNPSAGIFEPFFVSESSPAWRELREIRPRVTGEARQLIAGTTDWKFTEDDNYFYQVRATYVSPLYVFALENDKGTQIAKLRVVANKGVLKSSERENYRRHGTHFARLRDPVLRRAVPPDSTDRMEVDDKFAAGIAELWGNMKPEVEAAVYAAVDAFYTKAKKEQGDNFLPDSITRIEISAKDGVIVKIEADREIFGDFEIERIELPVPEGLTASEGWDLITVEMSEERGLGEPLSASQSEYLEGKHRAVLRLIHEAVKEKGSDLSAALYELDESREILDQLIARIPADLFEELKLDENIKRLPGSADFEIDLIMALMRGLDTSYFWMRFNYRANESIASTENWIERWEKHKPAGWESFGHPLLRKTLDRLEKLP